MRPARPIFVKESFFAAKPCFLAAVVVILYGNISGIVQILYALVAQPVEHLTFNQRARDSSSLERTKIPRRIVRFLVGFSIFWGSAHFCTLFAHRRESRVFPCIVRILCIVSRACRGKAPPFCCARPLCHLKAPPGLSLLRSARKRELVGTGDPRPGGCADHRL